MAEEERQARALLFYRALTLSNASYKGLPLGAFFSLELSILM
jgi:hypothetical protein